MKKPLQILTIDKDEKILRTASQQVTLEEILTPKFQKLITDLIEAALNAPMPRGWEPAGLAAIQVGVPKALFVASDIYTGQFKEYINPKIKIIGEKETLEIEGCLSIPKATGYVSRPKKIKITYLDREGNQHTDRVSGFNSRILQHEYDHTVGILFTDRMVENGN